MQTVPTLFHWSELNKFQPPANFEALPTASRAVRLVWHFSKSWKHRLGPLDTQNSVLCLIHNGALLEEVLNVVEGRDRRHLLRLGEGSSFGANRVFRVKYDLNCGKSPFKFYRSLVFVTFRYQVLWLILLLNLEHYDNLQFEGCMFYWSVHVFLTFEWK